MSAKITTARAIATAGGLGYSPVAPGTCGTAGAVPLVFALSFAPLWAFIVATLLVTIIGIWAAEVADESWGTHDSGRIVIDEVAGYMVTMAAVPRDQLGLLVAGFVLFRAADIIKPPPVRAIDKKLGGGLGVVLDDVAAGVLAGAAMYALARFQPLGLWGL
jgi:phosphatidylglycerophosphatase A